MQIYTLDTGLFKLDGGAMFGVVPKVLWSKKIAADENNLCNWAARCLLVEVGNRLIVIDTGLGNKQDEKFFKHYYRSGTSDLVSAVRKAGFDVSDVTDVILTHLHFDHVGGAVIGQAGDYQLTFPNAIYWTDSAQWAWALAPNPREKASFLRENLLPIQASGQLQFLDRTVFPVDVISFEKVFGHTEAMVLPIIKHQGKQLLFAADLIPSTAHLPLAWVMGYDVRPLQSMEEKERILKRVVEEQMVLVFEHDALIEAAVIEQSDRGAIVRQAGNLVDFI